MGGRPLRRGRRALPQQEAARKRETTRLKPTTPRPVRACICGTRRLLLWPQPQPVLQQRRERLRTCRRRPRPPLARMQQEAMRRRRRRLGRAAAAARSPLLDLGEVAALAWWLNRWRPSKGVHPLANRRPCLRRQRARFGCPPPLVRQLPPRPRGCRRRRMGRRRRCRCRGCCRWWGCCRRRRNHIRSSSSSSGSSSSSCSSRPWGKRGLR
mmetsp:Transcript_159453/g.511605  ORF Transcript_159453/g.511605 Transcript_159453/m.511605 type:complete len:211 (-) Transcript_159453:650-1282(-)